MTRALIAAVLCAVAAGIVLAAGIVDREIVGTQRNFVGLKYSESADALDKAERYLGFARWFPAAERRLRDVRARRAAMYYWQHQYDRIVPRNGDPLVDIPADNVDLQLIAANAAYRKSQPTAKDKASTLRALDAAANAYLAVLRNALGNEVAAYNYEYVVRLREDVDKGRHEADLTDTAEDGQAGRQGGLPPKNSKEGDLKILVPLDPTETDKATDPGKGVPIPRKG
jgi:hypothetical protein